MVVWANAALAACASDDTLKRHWCALSSRFVSLSVIVCYHSNWYPMPHTVRTTVAGIFGIASTRNFHGGRPLPSRYVMFGYNWLRNTEYTVR